MGYIIDKPQNLLSLLLVSEPWSHKQKYFLQILLQQKNHQFQSEYLYIQTFYYLFGTKKFHWSYELKVYVNSTIIYISIMNPFENSTFSGDIHNQCLREILHHCFAKYGIVRDNYNRYLLTQSFHQLFQNYEMLYLRFLGPLRQVLNLNEL